MKRYVIVLMFVAVAAFAQSREVCKKPQRIDESKSQINVKDIEEFICHGYCNLCKKKKSLLCKYVCRK